jgi:hypothetical protein
LDTGRLLRFARLSKLCRVFRLGRMLRMFVRVFTKVTAL